MHPVEPTYLETEQFINHSNANSVKLTFPIKYTLKSQYIWDHFKKLFLNSISRSYIL